MRAGTIEVVRHGNEFFFRSAGVLLDKLEASDFYMASLAVVRKGIVISTGIVFTVVETPIFGGLINILEERARRPHIDEIFPDYFDEGDELRFVLSHPFDWEINFREVYAEDEVAAKLEDMLARIEDIDEDSEEAEIEADAYSMLYQHELSHFKFPPNPILRRIE